MIPCRRRLRPPSRRKLSDLAGRVREAVDLTELIRQKALPQGGGVGPSCCRWAYAPASRG